MRTHSQRTVLAAALGKHFTRLLSPPKNLVRPLLHRHRAHKRDQGVRPLPLRQVWQIFELKGKLNSITSHLAADLEDSRSFALVMMK